MNDTQSLPLGFLYKSIFSDNGGGLFGNSLSALGKSASPTFSSAGRSGVFDIKNVQPNQQQGLFAKLAESLGIGGNTFQNLSDIGGAGMSVINIASGISDMINNRKKFKSDMENMKLSREIAQNQLNIARQEYARLQNQRKGITSAYGGA